jgi:hypothetical protein
MFLMRLLLSCHHLEKKESFVVSPDYSKYTWQGSNLQPSVP